MTKFFIFIILFFQSSALFASSFMCWDRNVTPVRSGFSSQKAAESWYPPYVEVSNDHIQWGESKNDWYKKKLNTGPGGNEWRLKSSDASYRFKYNKGVDTLSVFLSVGGSYKSIGQVQYMKCEQLGQTSNTSSNAGSSVVQSSFNKLSICNRKYVQQFLKGQGLYSGSIDGIWGGGTTSGLEKAGKKGKLKGLTSSKIIEKLSDNLVCE